jgi:hypothetical protein
MCCGEGPFDMNVPKTLTTIHFWLSLRENLEDFTIHDMRDGKHGRRTGARSQDLLAAVVIIAMESRMR